MINRLNDLDSKSYMKFLKSWCIQNENTLVEFITFFTKRTDENGNKTSIGIWGFSNKDTLTLSLDGRELINLEERSEKTLAYAMLNIRNLQLAGKNQTSCFFDEKLKPVLEHLHKNLNKRAYITILCSNYQENNSIYPAAWQIGKLTSGYFELKDEKLICNKPEKTESNYFPIAGRDIVFALNFRNTLDKFKSDRSVYKSSACHFPSNLQSWFILKPPPRKEKVKLHPAKFPEILIENFITHYSNKDDNIFDPMSGTGSTQVAALTLQRNAYGCEITDHFHQIALERLHNFQSKNKFYLAPDDAYNFDKHDEFPKQFDYIITSPPYWDMLNMNGAGTQKSRAQRGLMVNYSDLDTDLGNCADYEIFLAKLIKIYSKVVQRLKQGGHITIIVKNIKKKGTIYTFAWDLVEKLSGNLTLCQLNFWLQDDIRLAPYGFGNAWVSNTFHHYCLTFKKL